MRIERIELENWCQFEKFALEPHPRLNVLAGANGAGKTNLLEAISVCIGDLFGLRPVEKAITERMLRSGAAHGRVSIRGRAFDKSLSATILIDRTGNRVHAHHEGLSPHETTGSFPSEWRRRFADEHLFVPFAGFYRTERASRKADFAVGDESELGRAAAIGTVLSVVAFERFFRWFRMREDIENERRRDGGINAALWSDAQLDAVRAAIGKAAPSYSNLRVRRGGPGPALMLDKSIDGMPRTFAFQQLSDGERAWLILIADIARRLAMLNRERPLESEGVLLIDEVELHLHPGWQRTILASLRAAFPKLQIFATTHSPQVIGEVAPESVFVLRTKNGQPEVVRPRTALGYDSNWILEVLMDVSARDEETKEELNRYFALIDDGKIDEARAMRTALERKLGADEPEFARADVLLLRKEAAIAADRKGK